MRRIIATILLMIVAESHAYSLDNIFSFLKKNLQSFFTQKEIDKPMISLPKIPTIDRNPKDFTQIGKKNDRLDNPFYQQLTGKQRIELAIGLVHEVYLAVLERNPKIEEKENKVNILLQEGSREGIYHSLVLGREYRHHESVQNLLSDRNKKFVSHHFEIYLGIKINRQQLEKMDFHTVKRLTVARSLEVIDALQKKTDVHSWFAVFSEMMANTIEWKQKHRKLVTRKHYFHWAKKIPLDILKSEVIIKIHLLMNSLQ